MDNPLNNKDSYDMIGSHYNNQSIVGLHLKNNHKIYG
jgi:hypothetical protein